MTLSDLLIHLQKHHAAAVEAARAMPTSEDAAYLADLLTEALTALELAVAIHPRPADSGLSRSNMRAKTKVRAGYGCNGAPMGVAGDSGGPLK